MKTTATRIPVKRPQPARTARPVDDLLFIIAPPPHIKSDVAVLKDDVQYLVGHTLPDRFTPAHITLFRYADVHGKDMLDLIQKKASTLQPFNIFLKDFGVARQGEHRTIYLDIVNKYPIRELFEQLVKEDSTYVPTLPVARDLSSEDFLKCWPYLQGLKYSNQHFLCDRITVLQRQGKRWQHLTDIPLAA